MSVNRSLGSTFAPADPKATLAFFASEADDKPAAKVASGEVFEVRLEVGLGWDRLDINHDVTLHERVVEWPEPADVCASVPARFILMDCS